MDGTQWFLQGIALVNQKEYRKAIQCFTQCIQITQHVAESYQNMGVCYEILGDITNAFQTYMEAKQTHKIQKTQKTNIFDDCIQRLSVRCLANPDILQKIIGMYSDSYETNSAVSSAIIQNILQTRNNALFPILLQTCNNELRLLPNETTTHIHVGYMYFLVDESEQTLQSFRKIQNPPDDILHMLCVLKLKSGKYAKELIGDLAKLEGNPQWKLTVHDLKAGYYNSNDPANPSAKKTWFQYNQEYLREKDPDVTILSDWKGHTHVRISSEIVCGTYSEKDTYVIELHNVMLHNYFVYDSKFVYAGEKAFTKYSNRGILNPGQRSIRQAIFPLHYTNVDNYYHWNTENLVRYLEFKEYAYAIGFRGTVNVVIPEQCSSFIQESLDFLGVTTILRTDPTYAHACNTVYLIDYKAVDTHANDVLHIYSPSIRGLRLLSNTLRSKLPMEVPTKIVYARRKSGPRSVQNDAYLIDKLTKEFNDKFVVFEEGTFLEQATLFSKAKIVFGPHGAGLTNMLFCPKTAHVLEFQLDPISNRCFEYMSNALGLKYTGMNECMAYYYEKYTPTNEQMDTIVQRIKNVYTA